MREGGEAVLKDDYRDAAVLGLSVMGHVVMLPFVIVGVAAATILFAIDWAKGRI